MAEPPSMTLAEKLGLHRPELRAWAMYDWANSAFVTIVITAVFPIYFSAVATAGGAMDKTQATGQLSLVTTIAMLIGAFTAPVLGAIGDFAPIKKKLLGAFAFIGAASCLAMWFIRPGDWVLAAVLFGIGNVAATGSFVFYDALLPHIADRDEVDRVSTAGYAMGYIGGGILLLVQILAIEHPQWFGTDKDAVTRACLASFGVWWLLFSTPLFRGVPEPTVLATTDSPRGLEVLRRAFQGLRHTFAELRRFQEALKLMVAFLIYNDGIGTIIRMAAIYGDEKNIPTSVLIQAIVLTQFIGVPFAFAFGSLAGKLGSKRSIYLGLLVYVGISVLGYFMSESWHFLALAVLVGMVQGGTQALSRSLFSSLIPKHKSGEFFGLFAVFERFAGVLGPLVFTVVIYLVGSSQTAILAIIAFFVVGAWLLSRVDVGEGQRAARLAEAEMGL